MNLCMKIAGTALTLLLASPASAQEKPARPKGPISESGEINGARFMIRIPKNWNGGLILWAHGYTPPGTTYPLDGLPVSEGEKVAANREFPQGAQRPHTGVANATLAMGYAFAESAFSQQGMALREGVLDTEALRSHFVRKYGPAYPTIIAGAHNGGLITYDLIERFPEHYDGALAMGGMAMPKLELFKEYMFDMRVVFDYFFPGLTGSPVDWPPETAAFTYVREQVPKLVAKNPDKLPVMLRMFHLQDVNALARALNLYCSILRDVYVNRAKGNAFDNTQTIYSGSDDDAALNRGVRRYKSDPKAVEYVKQWSSPTGKISDPVIAWNALHDVVIPIRSVPYYAEATQRAGTSHLFVQTWSDSPAPYPGVEGTTFLIKKLEAWIKEGKRPESGELAELMRKAK